MGEEEDGFERVLLSDVCDDVVVYVGILISKVIYHQLLLFVYKYFLIISTEMIESIEMIEIIEVIELIVMIEMIEMIEVIEVIESIVMIEVIESIIMIEMIEVIETN